MGIFGGQVGIEDQDIQNYINQYIWSQMQGMNNANIPNYYMQSLLNSEGPWAWPGLGVNAVSNQLADLEKQRANLPNIQLGQFNLPPEIQKMMSGVDTGIGSVRGVIGAGGATPSSTALREQLNALMNGTTPVQAETFRASNALTQSGGQTDALKLILSSMAPIIAGGGYTDALNGLIGSGQGIVAAGGRTPENTALLNSLMGIISGGGASPESAALSSAGQGLISAGGMTGPLNELMAMVRKGEASGGFTPKGTSLFDAMMKIVNAGGSGGALQFMEQVQSFARDAAATAIAQQAEAARRGAFQRQGAAVGGGTVEQALAEFGDESARAEAAALREATMSQQQLQLQQLLGASGIASDTNKTAAGILASYLGLGGQVAGASAQNISSGGQMMSAAAQAAAQRLAASISGMGVGLNDMTNRLGIGAGMISDAEKTALARLVQATGSTLSAEDLARQNLGLGLSGLQGLTSGQLSAGQGLNTLFGTETANYQAALSALNELTKTNAGLFTGQQQLNVDQWKAVQDAFMNSQSTSSNVMGQYNNSMINAANALYGNSQSLYSPINLGSMFSVGGKQDANIAPILGAVAGGLLSGVGESIGGGRRSKSTATWV